MIRKVCPLIAGFLIFGVPWFIPLSAETGEHFQGTPDLGYVKIELTGNYRTREHLLLNVIQEALNAGTPEGAEKRITAALSGLEKFVSVEVSGFDSGEHRILQVKLEEKVSRLVVPAGFYTGSDWGGGLFLIDTNFSGTLNFLLAGGLWMSTGWVGVLGFIDSSFLSKEITFSVFSNAGRDLMERGYMDREIYQRYTEDSIRVFSAFDFFTSQKIRPRLIMGFEYRDILEGQGDEPEASEDIPEAPVSAVYAAPGIGITADFRSPGGFFKQGVELSGRYVRGIPLSRGRAYNSLSGQGSLSLPLSSKGRIFIQTAGEWSSRPDSVKQLLSGAGYRVLPAGISWAARSWGNAGEYERILFRGKWGTVTGLIFYEAGVYFPGTDAGQAVRFHGPGGGIRVYLNTVDLPALGLDVGYNPKSGITAVTVFLGMMMQR